MSVFCVQNKKSVKKVGWNEFLLASTLNVNIRFHTVSAAINPPHTQRTIDQSGKGAVMKLTRTKWDTASLALDETLFHTANGYLGVRGSLEEVCPRGVTTIRGCYINGVYDVVPLSYPERLFGFPEEAQRLVNLPDVQTMRLFLDGEEFSLFAGDVLAYERVLDTDKGVTCRKIRWKSPKGAIVDIEITRMASFVRQELFLTMYSVTSVDFDGEIELVSGVDCDVSNFVDESDPRVASERLRHIFVKDAKFSRGVGVVECGTGVSDIDIAICRQYCISREAKVKTFAENGIEARIKTRLQQGEGFLVEKFTTLSDSRRQKNPRTHAQTVLADAVATGTEELLQEQADFLAAFWRDAKVEISGSPKLQDGMDFNIYQLLQSAGRDAITSVASKGISGEGYEGHYFWDTEIYIFPFFLYTQPEIAKNLLDFRYNTLDAARAHAAIMGHTRGALYPWRTISGSECSSFFPAGSAQYHLTGDVAHAFMQYYYATDDVDFMAARGLEMLIETARLWLDAGNYDTDGKFHIHSITGPDEYTCCVSDNYYTNRCAQHNLWGAVEIYNMLKNAGQLGPLKIAFDEAELAHFSHAADAMFLPYDEKLGIHAQDSSFLQKPVWDLASTPKEKFPLLLHYHPLYLYRFQVCKQADTVLAHFLFEDGVSEDIMRRSYEYYDKITTHDSSLSGCVFGIMASRLGLNEKAYEYFTDTVRSDLDNIHGNTRDGLHVANLGGSWLAVVCGFAGLRLRKDGLYFRFTLPQELEGYSFHVRYRGSLLKVTVDRQGGGVQLISGEPVPVVIEEK